MLVFGCGNYNSFRLSRTSVRHTIFHPRLLGSSEKNTSWQCNGNANESGMHLPVHVVEVSHAEAVPIALNVRASCIAWCPNPVAHQYCRAMVSIIDLQYFFNVPYIIVSSFNWAPIANPPTKLYRVSGYHRGVYSNESAFRTPKRKCIPNEWIHRCDVAYRSGGCVYCTTPSSRRWLACCASFTLSLKFPTQANSLNFGIYSRGCRRATTVCILPKMPLALPTYVPLHQCMLCTTIHTFGVRYAIGL